VRIAETEAVSASEAKALFSELVDTPVLVLAVSGGPDSTALMVLAARWRDALAKKPKLIAVTIDHGLRAESKGEAVDVGRLARKLGIAHRVLRWTGRKPKTGVQEAARAARYRLLAKAAREAGACFILTAHTLDDQAETVLIRLTRGSGLTGLGGMQKISVIPGREPAARLRASSTRYGEQTRNPYPEVLRRMDSGPGPSVRPGMTKCKATLYLHRPLLEIPKARLIATLRVAKISFADDPTNRDPRFTRARLRQLMPALAEEGLTASGFARLARRLRQADRALEQMVEENFAALARRNGRALAIDAAAFDKLAGEIGLRLLARMLVPVAEGPVQLGKLEVLKEALDAAIGAHEARFRRSLAGALVTLRHGEIVVEPAPPRRGKVTRGKKRRV
jgi:tRNA(Ile)-lysidine synthase